MEWACRNFRFRHAYALALHADSCIKAENSFSCLNELSLAFGKRTFDFIYMGISILSSQARGITHSVAFFRADVARFSILFAETSLRCVPLSRYFSPVATYRTDNPRTWV
jgi:hypothetical protein